MAAVNGDHSGVSFLRNLLPPCSPNPAHAAMPSMSVDLPAPFSPIKNVTFGSRGRPLGIPISVSMAQIDQGNSSRSAILLASSVTARTKGSVGGTRLERTRDVRIIDAPARTLD
jgi:hypothetical protein